MFNLQSVSIMICSAQPKVLGEFYAKVFGKAADWSEGNKWYGWQVGNTYFTIGEHSEVKGKSNEPQRVILNFVAEKVKDEFARIKQVGAQVIKEPYELEGGWITTFADPDGNYFQITSPMPMSTEEQKSAGTHQKSTLSQSQTPRSDYPR